jgi:large subunit ribosomal protein L30
VSTIRIKWIRSGIGFSYYQKRIVRSLGLRKLNQEIEKPDTPQVRGVVAKIPHLVTIVEAAPKPAWMSVPEYTIHASQGTAKPASEPSNVAASPAESHSEAQPVTAPATPEAASDAPSAAVAAEESQPVDSNEEKQT